MRDWLKDKLGKAWPTWVAVLIAWLLCVLAAVVIGIPYGDAEASSADAPAAAQPDDAEPEADDAETVEQAPTKTCAKKAGKKRKKSLVKANAIVDRGQLSASAWPVARGVYERILTARPGHRCATKGLTRLAELEAEKAEADAAAEAAKAETDAEAKAAKAEEDKATALAARSWVERLEDGWTAVKKAYVSPLSGSGAVALAALLLLLVLSRLATGTVVHSDAVSRGEVMRKVLWLVGLLALVGAAVMTVWRSPAIADLASSAARDKAMVEVALAVLAVATSGVILMAWARGTRLAMQVDVIGSSGTTSPTDAKHLVSCLQKLGSEPPAVLRTTDASDVTSLPKDALTDVPTGAAAKAFFALLRVVRAAPPWKLAVSGDGTSLAVISMTRNGRSVHGGSISVSTKDFPVVAPASSDEPADGSSDVTSGKDRLLIAAAAHALITLKSRHPVLERGMSGADSWEALAMLALAMEPGTSVADRRSLISEAVDASPGYASARLAQVIEMETSSVEQWRRCARRLEDLDQEFADVSAEPGYEAFKIRLLYNLAIAWFNVRLYQGHPDGSSALSNSREAETALTEFIEKVSGRESVRLLLLHVKVPLAYLRADLATRGGRGPVEVSTLPTPVRVEEFYSFACLLVGLGRVHHDAALDALEVAVTNPQFKRYAADDPSFLPLSDIQNPRRAKAEKRRARLARFRKLVVAPPPDSILGLKPFAQHATKLKELGLTDLAQFDRLKKSTLAKAAGVHETRAAKWIDLAALDARATRTDPDRLSLLNLLLSLGINSRADLSARRNDREVLYGELVRAAAKTQLVPTRARTIDTWFR